MSSSGVLVDPEGVNQFIWHDSYYAIKFWTPSKWVYLVTFFLEMFIKLWKRSVLYVQKNSPQFICTRVSNVPHTGLCSPLKLQFIIEHFHGILSGITARFCKPFVIHEVRILTRIKIAQKCVIVNISQCWMCTTSITHF